MEENLVFEHIWTRYYWTIAIVIGLAIVLFYLIVILVNIKGHGRNRHV